jgi:predicted phosphodiesterase
MQTSQDRRRFLQTLTKAGAATLSTAFLPNPLHASGPAHLLEPADPAAGHIFLTQPYLQDPTPHAMTVMWITNLPAYSWVEYEAATPGQAQPTPDPKTPLALKAHSVTDGIVDAYNRLNRITLYDLQPGTTYRYRILSKEIAGFEPYQLTYGQTIQSELYSFTTPLESPTEMTCLILNDIHDRPASIPHLLDMNEQHPCDFVFLNGDMFDYQSDEQQIIDHLIHPCTQSFASQTPFLYVRGNHETRGKYRSELHHYFHNPGARQYWSFTWGPVHFTVLDTGEDKPDDTPVYAGIVDFDAYRQEQLRWAEEVMKSKPFKTAAFRVVLMHIPPFYSGDWHGTMHCRTLFNPLFNKHKVDMCISGHTHRYGVHAPVSGQHDYPIIIGGGPKEGERTLIKVHADKKKLQLVMLDDNKKVVGNYECRG